MSSSSLEQLFLEGKYQEILSTSSSSSTEQQQQQSKSVPPRQQLETQLFTILAQLQSKSLSSSSSSSSTHESQSSIIQNELKEIISKFEDDDNFIMMPRSSFYRIVATLTLVKLNLVNISQTDANNEKGNKNPTIQSKIKQIGKSLDLLSSVHAEAKDLSKREKVIDVILKDILEGEHSLKSDLNKFAPEWLSLISGSLLNEMTTSNNDEGENRKLQEIFKVDSEQLNKMKTRNQNKQHQQFFENNKSVYLDGETLSIRTRSKIAEGEVVLLEKGNNNNNNNNASSSVHSFIVSQHLRSFRGSFPHFFNSLCDLTDDEEEESNNNNAGEDEREKQNRKDRRAFRLKNVLKKLEATARLRDELTEDDFPGICSEVERYIHHHQSDENRSNNNENEKQNGDGAEKDKFQLRLEALAQFLFCRASIPLVVEGSSVMELEGDGLQFNDHSVPSAQKTFRPDQVAVSKAVVGDEDKKAVESKSSKTSSSSSPSSSSKELHLFIDETNNFLSDFHQPRIFFPLLSWIPHSCLPNCIAIMIPPNNRENNNNNNNATSYDDLKNSDYDVCLIALKEIQKNEPLSISRIGNFTPPSVRGSFCGGVSSLRVEKKKIAMDTENDDDSDDLEKRKALLVNNTNNINLIGSKVEVNENENETTNNNNNNNNTETQPPSPKMNYLACEFCNGPLGDLLESVVCDRCRVGCCPVDIPPSDREQHGRYAKCCGFCTVLLPMNKLHRDVVKHSEMAIHFLLQKNQQSNTITTQSSEVFKSIRVLHAVLMGLPVVTGNHHLRLRLCVELISAVQFQADKEVFFSSSSSSSATSATTYNPIMNSCGLASYEDVQRAKDACKILQDTVEKIVPVLSPLRPALWMASVRVFGISARFQYFEMETKLIKESMSATNPNQRNNYKPPPPFNVVYMREQCPKDFAEARDRVSYAFESHSVIFSAIRKATKGLTDSDHAKSPTEIVENFLECFKDDLAVCGVTDFRDVVEMMRMSVI